jgi:N4-gp56 family major capsid protein
MPINTTATINTGSGAVATKPAAFYNKVLLKTLRARSFQHEKFAQARPMPKHAGDTVNFRKIGVLAPATTPLTEGVTPTGNSATITAISATTKQYGDFIEFSDVVNFQLVDPVLAEYSKEQGVQASETKDVLVRDELHGGSSVNYPGTRTTRASLAVGDKPSIDQFRKAALTLKKNKVKKVNGRYITYITPEVTFDLLDDPKFLKAYEIGQNNKPLIEGEIADVYGIKFIEVENGKTFAGTGVTVHSCVMFGEEAYGITKIEGEGDVEVIVKGLGSSGSLDPLNQRQTIGWKINAFVAKRLKEEALIRIESVPSNQ